MVTKKSLLSILYTITYLTAISSQLQASKQLHEVSPSPGMQSGDGSETHPSLNHFSSTDESEVKVNIRFSPDSSTNTIRRCSNTPIGYTTSSSSSDEESETSRNKDFEPETAADHAVESSNELPYTNATQIPVTIPIKVAESLISTRPMLQGLSCDKSNARYEVLYKQMSNFSSPSFQLERAIKQGDVKEVERLIKDTSLRNRSDEQGNSWLHIAAQEKQPKVVRILLKNKLPINAINQACLTPLALAILKGEDLETIQLLAKSGGQLNAKDIKLTPENTLLESVLKENSKLSSEWLNSPFSCASELKDPYFRSAVALDFLYQLCCQHTLKVTKEQYISHNEGILYINDKKVLIISAMGYKPSEKTNQVAFGFRFMGNFSLAFQALDQLYILLGFGPKTIHFTVCSNQELKRITHVWARTVELTQDDLYPISQFTEVIADSLPLSHK